ncbi:hypothetical protein [Myxacorys almedinensis]|uniref:Uncharacterized protein n=1 Tax=Myxacorys almedinensis A TaxID=2690445 RepID=A0A8J8CLM6_9CYAN|nr:hypothetical protein [Myxacorys almedinensis]NDJ16277.1 hypothetical protein [Myxacorys almedinensis A]
MEISPRFLVSDPISFEQAIDLTQSLMAELQHNPVTEAELESIITALVQSENGARGFFVTYLTDEQSLADQPSSPVVAALRSSPAIVSELLVKNLAMSTAMKVAHTRNQNPELAAGSNRVQTRTLELIRQTQIPDVSVKLEQLGQSAETESGEYQSFLKRWNYDEDQRRAIAHVVSTVVT